KLLLEYLKSLPVSSFVVEIGRVKKSGLDASDFRVILDEEHENHDHDNEYLYGHHHGHEYPHEHGHEHGGEYTHLHEHEHEHVGEHCHPHEHTHEHVGEHCHPHEHVHMEEHCHPHIHEHVHVGEYEHPHTHEHKGEHEYPHTHEHKGEHEHPHTHEHSHPHEHGHVHMREHEHPHEHMHMGEHEHPHTHEHSHPHEHRGLPEILDIIRNSGIPKRAKRIAEDIFTILAEAEAKAHGTAMDEVHFHEVGAVDSIVDIVAAAVCLDNLNITEVIVPELYEGKGTVRCQHGIIPVPVPAVVNIVGRHGIALHMTETEAELVTPTGAAIVAAVRTSDRLPGRYKLRRTGMGAGKRDYGRASVLRGMLIEPEEPKEEIGINETDVICKLESNIDDCTGEALGYVMDRLLEAGARDVNYTPIYMKKNRPAYQLNVICKEDSVPEMEEIIFRETTTIGIRRMK
ncbi:MAG: nickel pincer cofactor biosynthesis protein LarC, partial [Lachnospiraceae bacterium]|nr:nickel pincer cofactor biosynthesis protein LarC [Lachnospiraceae bacterium]